MQSVTLLYQDLYPAALIFARVGTVLTLLPGFGERFVFSRMRLALAFFLTLLLFPNLRQYFPAYSTFEPHFLYLLGLEFLVGLFIGLAVRLIVLVLEFAGSAIGFEVGLTSAQAFNPEFGGQTNVISNFIHLSVVTLLFCMDLHHLLLKTLIESYQVISATNLPAVETFSEAIVHIVSQSFHQAVQLAMPLFLIVTIFYAGMGFINRFIPQVQVFFVALPMQLTLGFLTFVLMITGLLLGYMNFFSDTVAHLWDL